MDAEALASDINKMTTDMHELSKKIASKEQTLQSICSHDNLNEHNYRGANGIDGWYGICVLCSKVVLANHFFRGRRRFLTNSLDDS